MDIWKFYDITHREHTLCNALSDRKLDDLITLLRLPTGSRVVEIACGKGEFLVRLAEAYGVSGTAVDISPYTIADAERLHLKRVPTADLVFKEMDGKQFASETTENFDLAACIGADWIFGGYGRMLEALRNMVVPGGWVIGGSPYWLQAPCAEYLAATGASAETYGTHAENVAAGEALGLKLAYTLVSNADDWDRYHGLQWYAVEQFARDHPEDADLAEVLQRADKDRELYLTWERETLGWAVYAFRRALD